MAPLRDNSVEEKVVLLAAFQQFKRTAQKKGLGQDGFSSTYNLIDVETVRSVFKLASDKNEASEFCRYKKT